MTEAKSALNRFREDGRLSAAEYAETSKVLKIPEKSENNGSVITYRNRIVHRIRPSIDHAELTPTLQSRTGVSISNLKGTPGVFFPIYATASKPEFRFDDLYGAITDYLSYMVEMLKALKSMPSFA